jgi:tetratricopeptide (TPR) repeat protein
VAEKLIDELRARRAALEARLTAPNATAELDPLKAEIGALFKTVEAELLAFNTLRVDVMQLVDQWKTVRAIAKPSAIAAIPANAALSNSSSAPTDAAPGTMSAATPSLAPQFVSDRPVVHADHIGASTFIEKGWSKISAGDHVGAEQSLMRALELSPNDPQAESLLGWALMLQDKFDDALLNFQKVLVREPQNALARINVGYICLKKHIFGEAIEHLSRAIRLDNDKKATLYAHFYLGLVYLERDMFEDAQTFFQKTLALGPNLIEAYFELGRAYWFNGQRDEAVNTWKQGVAANKFSPWGKRCAEILATVEAGGEP